MPLPTGNGRRAIVRVCASALLDMLVAATEAAVAPPSLHDQSVQKLAAINRIRRGRHVFFEPDTLPISLLFSHHGLPVAGLLFGREEVVDDLATFTVERMFPRSANRSEFGCSTSPQSPAIMAEVARAAGASFEIIGDFRSWPRLTETPAQIALSRSYRLERTKSTAPAFAGDRVALAMTITRATDTAPTPLPSRGPAVQLRVGGWEVWLSALLRHRRMPTQGPELVVEWWELATGSNASAAEP